LLTLGLPPGLTAATGMDAFTHCLETFVSPLNNPPAEAIAIDGLERVNRWIKVAVADGANKEARWHMMMGGFTRWSHLSKGPGSGARHVTPARCLERCDFAPRHPQCGVLPIVYETNLDAIALGSKQDSSGVGSDA